MSRLTPILICVQTADVFFGDVYMYVQTSVLILLAHSGIQLFKSFLDLRWRDPETLSIYTH